MTLVFFSLGGGALLSEVSSLSGGDPFSQQW